jgi:hypothetical protein
MKTFKDNAGRTWTVDVNIATVKRVKSMLKIDLLDVIEGKLLDKIVLNPLVMCDVVYAICKPEADSQNIDDEKFGYAMAGDALEYATGALLQELIDFFPESKRPVLRASQEKFLKYHAKSIDLMTNYLNSPELEEKMEKELKRMIDLSGNWLESPE